MVFRPVDRRSVAQLWRRHGAVAVLAALAVAAFVVLAGSGIGERRAGARQITEQTSVDAAARAQTILDRQRSGLDALATAAATQPDAATQQLLDGLPALLPGVRIAALTDASGAVQLRGTQAIDQSALALLTSDAASQAAARPGTEMLLTSTFRAGDAPFVGVARPWFTADGRFGGVGILVLDPAAFAGLDLVRADGTPLFAAHAASGARAVALAGYPLKLALDPAAPAAWRDWRFIAAAGVGVAALLGLIALFAVRLDYARRVAAMYAADAGALRRELTASAAAADRTDEVNRTKSQFFAQVTHELRTPLNAILGFSETIGQQMFGPVANPRYLEYAGLINEAGSHLLSLINDLLDNARIEAGKMEVAPIRLSAMAMARSALDLVELLAQGRNITLATAGLTSCPDLNVDPRAIKQVLVNLLSNAIKYTPPGGRIELRCWQREDGGAAIEISDTGIGMSVEDLRVAFEPFGRAGSAEARRQQGSGLGLSLARALVRLHGGDLTLSSQLDFGTVATISLPPTAVAAAPAQRMQKNETPAKAA